MLIKTEKLPFECPSCYDEITTDDLKLFYDPRLGQLEIINSCEKCQIIWESQFRYMRDVIHNYDEYIKASQISD